MTDDANITDDLATIDASELGKLIGRATSTVKKDLARRPETLPPVWRAPGSNRPRWRIVDVRAWMQALADLEMERRAAAVEFARKVGAKPDFAYQPFQLAAAKNGKRARERMESNAAKPTQGD